MLPFVVSYILTCPLFGFNGLYNERKAHLVGNLSNLPERFLVVIEFVSVNTVGVYNDVTVDVLLINVCALCLRQNAAIIT